MIRNEPLETAQVECLGQKLTVPTQAESLRIKDVLILMRNAARGYLDFVALFEHMGDDKVVEALRSFDRLYPQPNEESADLNRAVTACRRSLFGLAAGGLVENMFAHLDRLHVFL